MQHKFAIIDSVGNEQKESNIIKTEYEKEFQQRLESRQITPRCRNIKEITDKMFDTCSGISKVQSNQPEITKDEVQSAIKTLLAHECYDPASLKNDVFKSGMGGGEGGLFLNSVTKMLNWILKEKQPPEQWEK